MLAAPINRSRAKIFVVDDSPEMLRYLRLLLELDRYQVETVSSGMEALQRLRDGYDPDVVLLDNQMPGMDGLTTLWGMHKLRPHLKVIMCSGLFDDTNQERAAALGAVAYISKPVQHLYLTAALERCLTIHSVSAAGKVQTDEQRRSLTLLPSLH